MSTLVAPGCGLIFTFYLDNSEPVMFFNMESPKIQIFFFSSFSHFPWLCFLFSLLSCKSFLWPNSSYVFLIFVYLSFLGFSHCFWIRFQHIVIYFYLLRNYLALKVSHFDQGYFELYFVYVLLLLSMVSSLSQGIVV